MIEIIALYVGLSITTYPAGVFLSSMSSAHRLKKSGIIRSKDILWDVGCGMTGAEALGIGISTKECYGIDPNMLIQKKGGKTKLLRMSLEEALENPDIQSPDFIFAKNYSGMQRDIGKIMEMEPQPTLLIAPCNCRGCKKYFFKADYPVSNRMMDEYGKRTYFEINPKDPAALSAYDMALFVEEHGYSSVMGQKRLSGNYNVLLASKDNSRLNFEENGSDHI